MSSQNTTNHSSQIISLISKNGDLEELESGASSENGSASHDSALTSKPLTTLEKAAKALTLSRNYLYRLPDDTPGKYRFGNAVRFDLDELRAWAAGGK